MANLAKLEFEALDISGKNYLSWILDAEIHLDAKELGDTIKLPNETSNKNKAQAMIFLRHHLHEGLKSEYLTIKDPAELWRNLIERYDHQKTVILPKARYDWMHLRLQDFKSVSEYNSALFKISSQLKLCGENITDDDLLEKSFSTFHASNVLLQQQYREKGFKRYSELISCLLVAEQNNELLMRNHESRPTGSAPFPEVNVMQSYNRGRSRGRGRGRGRGRNQFRYGEGQSSRINFHHQKFARNERPGKIMGGIQKKTTSNNCLRCGMQGHWQRTCRTPKHLADLYQESIKSKGKNMETNYVQNDYTEFVNGLDDITHIDVADFLIHPNDENVKDRE